MSIIISSDLAYEPKQWLKMVDALQGQNNDLKEELSLILRRQQPSAALLKQFDSFQTQLLDIDAAILLLRQDVAAQQGRSNCNGVSVAAEPAPQKLGLEIDAMEANMAALGRQLECLGREPGSGPEQHCR